MNPSRQLFAVIAVTILVTTITTAGISQVAPEIAAWRSWQHAHEAGRAAQWVDYHARQAAQNPQHPELSALAWQWKAYETDQQRWASYYRQWSMSTAVARPVKSPSVKAQGSLPPITLRDGYAFGLNSLPLAVHRIIEAGNALQNKPYILGGGHRRLEDLGYDCSSTVSYVLIKAGQLQEILNSARFADYGAAGPGRYVTIWVKPGNHVFVTICGLRLDTSGGRVAEGPRWRTSGRSVQGFTPRHPLGL